MGRASRRELVLGAGAALAIAPVRRARAARKTLRIAQWVHFVPEYDRWFDGVFARAWGDRHGTEVVVDHIAAGELNTRAAAEASARRGHDLFMFQSPPAAYEAQAVDMTPVYQEVERRHGPKIDLAHRSTFNPRTGRYFAFSDSYVPDPGNYRADWWAEAGYPSGPRSWDDLRAGARKIRDATGHPCGLGLSQEPDSSMALRALLWSFGGAEQDEAGRVTLDSRETIEALKYMRALHRESQTPEVFSWDPSSNNRAILAGRVSYVQNAISVTRTAEREKQAISSKILLCEALAGPARRIAASHVMCCYVLWSFAENKEGAQQFLVDLCDAFHEAFVASRCYNFPCFARTVPDLPQLLAHDAAADPPTKYQVLADALGWTTNVGYPGYATAAIDEAYRAYLLPTMFARVARGDESPEEAARSADAEYRRIFGRWR